MGKTLSIETGIRCSNRCSFCYQLGWRTGGNQLPDPTFAALLGKLEWGRENGYDQLGFSGGEPTIRKDFLELVRLAREMGYVRVGLTTNGRRFANKEFAQEALQAGIDSIGWSLHGADSLTHDKLVGREGAFEQLRQGIANIEALCRGTDRHVDQNLFILVNQQNHLQLSDICRLGRGHGIKLMILQPVIYSKGNLAMAAEHSLPLPELLAAIRQAAQDGIAAEWFVKLFNLPPCFFTEELQALEHQRYPVDVFRYQEKRRAGESKVAAGQGYLRLDRCGACLLEDFCPGLHQSLMSQADLSDIIGQTAQVPAGESELWLAGLELLEPDTLLAHMRALTTRFPSRPLRVYYGGDGVAGGNFAEALVEAKVGRISLVYSGLEQSATELSARSGGNASRLLSFLQMLPQGGADGLRLSLAVPYIDSVSHDEWDRVMRFAAAGCHRLEIQVPWDFKNPEVFEYRKFRRLGRRWISAGGQDWEVALPSAHQRGTLVFRLMMALQGCVSRADLHYVPHFFSGPRAGWVAGSVPSFARRRDSGDGSDPVLRGLPGEPIDESMLEQMRPG
jgi:uncharacterized Fe-S cluster-containing radical SAM superfamily protein